MLHPITVVNRHHPGAKGEYIGRGTPLGNPFKLGDFVNRDSCVQEYANWVSKEIQGGNVQMMAEIIRLTNLAEIRPLNLVCSCAPLRCHGDIIKTIIEEYHQYRANGGKLR